MKEEVYPDTCIMETAETILSEKTEINGLSGLLHLLTKLRELFEQMKLQDRTAVLFRSALFQLARAALAADREFSCRWELLSKSTRLELKLAISPQTFETTSKILLCLDKLSETLQSEPHLHLSKTESGVELVLDSTESALDQEQIRGLKELLHNNNIQSKKKQTRGKQKQLSTAEFLFELECLNAELVNALIKQSAGKNKNENVDNLKTQFLANVSHEIRTPMNAIMGLVAMLERSQLNIDQKKYLSLIKDSGNSLLAIINDLLDLSKIEAGKFDLNLKPIDLERLLQTTLQIMHHQADLKNLSLCLNYRVPGEPLIADPVRIRQLLINLISNAIKFSQQGQITINVDSLSREGRLRKVRFEVIDQGIGISREKQAELFRPFVQVDGATKAKATGTGLGLSICKKLVTLMDGSIDLESQEGGGSKFWFELPLELAEDKLEVTAQLAAIRQDNWKPLEGCRILVAEDHPLNQMVAVAELEEGGAAVDIANDGMEACRRWKDGSYDLIFMDCQMPVMDGFDAAKQLRESGCSLPIIAMTASAMQGDRERCLESGMSDYLSKPFEQNELREIASRYFKQNIEPELTTRAKAETKPKNSLDKRALEIRYGQNWRRLLDSYMQDLEKRLASMGESFHQGQFQALAKDAHALMGASGLVFLRELQATFAELEIQAKNGKEKQTEIESSLEKANEYFRILVQQLSQS